MQDVQHRHQLTHADTPEEAYCIYARAFVYTIHAFVI